MWNLTSSGKKEYMTPCPARPSTAVIYFLRWDLTPRGLGLHLPSCPQRRLHQHSSPCWPVSPTHGQCLALLGRRARELRLKETQALA